jgi:hypothetical protein
MLHTILVPVIEVVQAKEHYDIDDRDEYDVTPPVKVLSGVMPEDKEYGRTRSEGRNTDGSYGFKSIEGQAHFLRWLLQLVYG